MTRSTDKVRPVISFLEIGATTRSGEVPATTEFGETMIAVTLTIQSMPQQESTPKMVNSLETILSMEAKERTKYTEGLAMTTSMVRTALTSCMEDLEKTRFGAGISMTLSAPVQAGIPFSAGTDATSLSLKMVETSFGVETVIQQTTTVFPLLSLKDRSSSSSEQVLSRRTTL